VTFSRSTTAPYYDGKTSVLAEQNLLLQSQVLTNATYWIAVNSTVTGNSTTAPDGTTTANTVTDNATNGGHRVYQGNGNLSTATALTASAYFLQGTGTFGQLGLYDGSAYRTVTANLSTGVITETFGTATSTITSVGGGWYRLTISFTGGSSNATISIGLSNTGTPGGLASYVGTGSTIYAWGAQLEQRSSVTAYNATTTSAITNYIPQLLTAPINAPRFDFNPTTGESLGLLIEQSSTNLLTYSQDFTNAAWGKSGVTITQTAGIAPDGTQTMQLLIEDTSTGSHQIAHAASSGPSITSGTAYTCLVYVKTYGRTRFSIIFDGATFPANSNAYFDTTTGVPDNLGSGVTASMTSVGNNVYKCVITATANATLANRPFAYLALVSTGTTTSYTGNGYSGIYIWGMQGEALAFPTSYIATTSAQVTRASDNAIMTGTNFSSWFNQWQGTLYGESATLSTSISGRGIFSINDGTSNNVIQMYNNSVNASAEVVLGGVTQAAFTINSINTANVFNKRTLAYAINNTVYCASGTLSSVDTSCNIPTVTQLVIGRVNGSALGSEFNGWMKKLAYYPQAVTSAQSQALTGS
jgi:hypothetical protein